MSAEGRLEIRVLRGDGRSPRATIRSSRPLALANVFAGRPADDVVRLLPRLYSVCGVAQGVAAATACERAAGVESIGETAVARQLLVEAETWREHLLRILRDWQMDHDGVTGALRTVMEPLPKLLTRLGDGEAPLALGARTSLDRAALLPVVESMDVISGDLVFGESPERFLARESFPDLEAWCMAGATPAARTLGEVLQRGWQSAGNAPTPFLPGMPDDELLARLLADETGAFRAAPTWRDLPRETTPYSRQAERPLVRALAAQHGNGLLARLTALLVEVATLPLVMRALLESSGDAATGPGSSFGIGSGTGIAQIEAARGRLVHGVEIADGLVARYGILAPTEWNFHGDGVAARGLENLDAVDSESLSRQAELLIHAIDPCVGYRLEWADA